MSTRESRAQLPAEMRTRGVRRETRDIEVFEGHGGTSVRCGDGEREVGHDEQLDDVDENDDSPSMAALFDGGVCSSKARLRLDLKIFAKRKSVGFV